MARTGGDEFKILLPDTALAAAVAIAGRIGARVGALAIATDDPGVTVAVTFTVSIRCAAVEGDLATAERVANAPLYQAKALGRNRLVSGKVSGETRRQGEPKAGTQCALLDPPFNRLRPHCRL